MGEDQASEDHAQKERQTCIGDVILRPQSHSLGDFYSPVDRYKHGCNGIRYRLGAHGPHIVEHIRQDVEKSGKQGRCNVSSARLEMAMLNQTIIRIIGSDPCDYPERPRGS